MLNERLLNVVKTLCACSWELVHLLYTQIPICSNRNCIVNEWASECFFLFLFCLNRVSTFLQLFSLTNNIKLVSRFYQWPTTLSFLSSSTHSLQITLAVVAVVGMMVGTVLADTIPYHPSAPHPAPHPAPYKAGHELILIITHGYSSLPWYYTEYLLTVTESLSSDWLDNSYQVIHLPYIAWFSLYESLVSLFDKCKPSKNTN